MILIESRSGIKYDSISSPMEAGFRPRMRTWQWLCMTLLLAAGYAHAQGLSAENYSRLGDMHLTRGELDQAISSYNKAIELNPKLADAHNNRGLAYARKEQYDHAAGDFSRAIEINPTFDRAYNNLGNSYVAKGEPERAISNYDKAIAINSKLADAHNNRALAYYLSKQYDKAWDDVHRAQDLGYPVNPAFLEALRKESGRDK